MLKVNNQDTRTTSMAKQQKVRLLFHDYLNGILYYNRDSNRGCLVFMFSLRVSGNKFLINLRWQFRVRKIFCTQVFARFAVFLFCV